MTSNKNGGEAHAHPMRMEDVAAEFGLPIKTLRYWRYQGTGGPPSFKIGRRVVYDRADVLNWYDALRQPQPPDNPPPTPNAPRRPKVAPGPARGGNSR